MIFASLHQGKEEIKFAFVFSLSSSFAAGSRSYLEPRLSVGASWARALLMDHARSIAGKARSYKKESVGDKQPDGQHHQANDDEIEATAGDVDGDRKQ